MEFTEPDEHTALRSAVGRITDAFGPAYFRDKAASGEPTTELWRALGEHGFIGINIPETYGGGGAGLAELVAVCEETAARGCPLLLLLVSSAISGEVIARYGTEAQRKEWLPRLASGETKVVFAITEPDAGSNSHQLKTTARREGADYVLNGTKHYISGIEEASAILVVARTSSDTGTGRGRLSLFLVPTDAPGLVKHPLPIGIGLPERQHTLHFDDVRVPADDLIGSEGDGFAQVFHGLNPERITGAAVCVGVGRYALARAVEYAKSRAVWDDVPIGAHQGVAHPLAEAKIQVELAALVTAKAAWLHDNELPAGEASNTAKFAAAEASLAAVNASIQAHGGNGMSAEYGLLPMWALARLLRIAPVNRELILSYVAQHSLGLPKSY